MAYGVASPPSSQARDHGNARGAPFRARFPVRKSYAAIDLGTNNCRMLIARPEGDGFFIVDAFSRIVRLGEGLSASGRLSDIAMDRAVSALSVCADKLVRRNVTLARSVATEACRRAGNGGEFVDRVYTETGIKLDVISTEEEAHLAVLGCHRLIEEGEGPALVFDIGGGSTELVIVDTRGDEPQILDWLSVPWGVVSLAESQAQDHETLEGRLAIYEQMRGKVRESFAAFAERQPAVARELRLLGTSGTITTLASVYLELPSYDRKQIDGLIVPSAAIRAISADLAARSISERALLPCIGHERADLVVAGCAILDAILDIWPAERIGVADRGIREGILRRLMQSGVSK
jgi:exopolyphosphatase / guanosine-5'-triphosphate,3'-diphosphate pyrophosphatase